jgi:hypothetical protein
MRVDALCDVAAGMAEDAALGCLVRAGIIKQCSHGMSAVVSSMAIGTDEMHDGPPYCAVPAIVVRPSRIIANKGIPWTFHAGFYEWCDTVMYGDDADAGGGFAPCDASGPVDCDR